VYTKIQEGAKEAAVGLVAKIQANFEEWRV
jgi:hypothetical protein